MAVFNIVVAIREEQISARMGFGHTPAEKRERAAIYAGEIARQSSKLDAAIEKAQAALAEADKEAEANSCPDCGYPVDENGDCTRAGCCAN
jgi:hypothetical protein